MIIKQIPLLALALVLCSCQPAAPTQSSDQYLSGVVKRQDLTGYSFFDGKLVIPESAQAVAYAPYATSVMSVMTGEGKQVDRGDPLVKLTIPGADATTKDARSAVADADASYSSEKTSESGPVHDAHQALDAAKSDEAAARKASAAGNPADVDAATQTRVDAEADLKAARRTRQQTLEPSQQAVDEAGALLVNAKADAAKGIVRAPLSGTVVAFHAQPGMTTQAKDVLATIINFDTVRVQGLVPAELKSLVVKDARVIVAMNGPNSDPLDGVVVDVTVAPPIEGQASPGYLAVIRLLHPKGLTQPNLSVRRIGVKTGTVTGVLVVPVGAIVMKDGKASVSVQSGTTWVDTPVEVGGSDGALAEIKSGLAEGATVRIASSTAGN